MRSASSCMRVATPWARTAKSNIPRKTSSESLMGVVHYRRETPSSTIPQIIAKRRSGGEGACCAHLSPKAVLCHSGSGGVRWQWMKDGTERGMEQLEVQYNDLLARAQRSQPG